MLEKRSNYLICKNCNAEFPDEGDKFCRVCGEPMGKLEEVVQESFNEIINCPNCNTEVEPGLKFCTECGKKIDQTNPPSPLTNCPNCNTEVEPGLKFCTECGKKIRGSNGDLKDKKSNWLENPVKNISKTSKNFFSGVDDILTSKKSENNPRLKTEKFKPIRIKGIDNPNPGYLICNACGGVYTMKSCESVDDFSDQCECGGKITHFQNLPSVRPRRK
ncbi:MAG: zinc ribbon domain-containing protein [Methanobacteriaceae archaeon]|jgi:rRNA maturation endonuclease Nob1|nr:zinc ribbon domain-containing protein [Methanobacteriaceae archaeon]